MIYFFLFKGCSSDFSSSVLNVWIGRCTLYINYTRPAGNDTCSPRNYRVIVGSEHGDIITRTDTDILKYSYYDINSTSRYTVNVKSAFLCNGLNVWGDARYETILASIGKFTFVQDTQVVDMFHFKTIVYL